MVAPLDVIFEIIHTYR
jgi:hypothetical protein